MGARPVSTDTRAGHMIGLMSLAREIQFLAETPLFEGVDAVRLEVLAFTAKRFAVPAGAILATENEAAAGALLLLAGDAIMMSRGPEGEARVLRLDAGDLVGEAALMQPSRWLGTVRAASDVEFLLLEREMFLRLTDEFPEIARGCLRAATRQVSGLADDIATLRQSLASKKAGRLGLARQRKMRNKTREQGAAFRDDAAR
ncbi:MAG: cyclic nucleotide-binding domain-containing protein [Parvibaculum sp.]